MDPAIAAALLPDLRNEGLILADALYFATPADFSTLGRLTITTYQLLYRSPTKGEEELGPYSQILLSTIRAVDLRTISPLHHTVAVSTKDCRSVSFHFVRLDAATGALPYDSGFRGHGCQWEEERTPESREESDR